MNYTIEDLIAQHVHDSRCDGEEVHAMYQALLADVAQLRAGHALLVAWGRAEAACEQARVDYYDRATIGTDEYLGAVEAAAEAQKSACDRALSLVASPAQAVKP